MPRIRPIKDLRKATEISEMCHEPDEPIYTTKNGYGDLVVMSIEACQLPPLNASSLKWVG